MKDFNFFLIENLNENLEDIFNFVNQNFIWYLNLDLLSNVPVSSNQIFNIFCSNLNENYWNYDKYLRKNYKNRIFSLTGINEVRLIYSLQIQNTAKNFDITYNII